MHSIHQFKVKGINQAEIDFATFSGKKILIVNVASECGFTPQYRQLQELYEAFKDKLVVVGFPCNDFGGQEPGSSSDIHTFCTRNYGVSFPLATKVSILPPNTHPIYKWLTQKEQNGKLNSSVRWNFHKYLLDEQGALVATYPSSTSPIDETIIDWVQK